jgi:hypothetical protein
MKQIKVTSTDRIMLIDDEDFEYISKFSVYMRNNKNQYPTIWLNNKSIPVHQVITGIKLVDHKDGNVFNNQKSNLRPVTKQQNSFNARKASVKRSSKYKGVSFTKYGWKATICKDYKNQHLGYFEYEEQAAAIYDLKAKELFGEYACLNFS